MSRRKKTWYAYGNLTRDGFHVILTLYNESEREGYFPLCVVSGKNKRDAWVEFIRMNKWLLPRDYKAERRFELEQSDF